MRSISAALLVLTACGGPPGADSPTAQAPIQGLDPAFGTEGRTLLSFKEECPASNVFVSDVAKTATGFVAVGQACRGWILVGYGADGKVDPGFGTAGKTKLFASQSNNGSDYYATGVWVQPDGKLLVRGHTRTATLLRRFSATGQPDESMDGTFDAALKPGFPFWFALGLQPDGKMVVAGKGEQVMRLNPDGSRDVAFGTDGVATLSLFGSESFVEFVRVRPDGSIALAGHRATDMRPVPYVVVVDAAGKQLWTSELTPTVEKGENRIEALAVAADGAVLLAGSDFRGTGTSFVPAIWRLTPAGVLDTAFGSGGRAEGVPSALSGAMGAIEVLPDGRIVAAGAARTGSGDNSWAVARLTSDGQPDAKFHRNGVLVFDLELPALSAGATAIVPDGKGYVVGGIAFPASGGPNSVFAPGFFAVARVTP